MNARDLAGHPWPRTYRASRGHRILFGGLGALLIAGCVVWEALLLLRPISARAADRALLVVVALLALFGALLLAAFVRERVVLHRDAVEFHELGRGVRRVRRDEIVGWRFIPLQHGLLQVVLELRGLGRKPLKATVSLERDEAFDAWWAGIPDLDAAERQRSEAELLASEDLGSSREERAAALDRARRLAGALRFVALGLGAWGLFAPRPYALVLALLAVLPAVAAGVVMAGRGRYSVEGQRNDLRPELITPLVAPGFVLALRIFTDVPLVDHRALLLWSALAALGLVATLAAGDASLRRRPLVLVLMTGSMVPYTWGLLGAANALLDLRASQAYRVAVTGKHVTSGKHTSYLVRLAPFGPVGATEVDVGRARYEAIAVGEMACVELHPGALGQRWLSLPPCP